MTADKSQTGSGPLQVGVGIFVSRIFGLLRESVIAGLLGAGAYADVYAAVFKGSNLLQNLLGEQSLSASFIPIYSRMLGEGRKEDAGRFAGAIFGLLLTVAASVALLGVVLAEPFVALVAPGFVTGGGEVDRFGLAVSAVRWVFPMTCFLVLSAWALGVLNSHRRFLLPYLAPVLWNLSIIIAVVLAASAWKDAPLLGVQGPDRLVLAACVGALVGGVLQFAVQLPLVFRLMHGFRLSFSSRVEGVRAALRALGPVVTARGAVQLSSYLDVVLASLLLEGAVSGLQWGARLYLLPVSLFGLSIVAAELPELARRTSADSLVEMRQRVDRSLRLSGFLNIATLVGYWSFGFLIVGAIFRRGRFDLAANGQVYLILAAYSLGLLASTSSRLLTNVFYSFQETKTPARIAVQRVLLSAVTGMALALWLDRFSVDGVLGLDGDGSKLYLGGVGLALGAGLASWFELWRLRRAVSRHLEEFRLPWGAWVLTAAVAAVAALVGAGVWWGVPATWVLPAQAVCVLGAYGLTVLALARAIGVPEARIVVDRFGSLLGLGRRREE